MLFLTHILNGKLNLFIYYGFTPQRLDHLYHLKEYYT